jgi:hypothetical protein
MAATRWLVFTWGFLACAAMVYFGVAWLVQVDNPLRHELSVGFATALLYGWPAWLGLPTFVVWQRHNLTTCERSLLLSPVAVAVLLFALGSLVGWV